MSTVDSRIGVGEKGTTWLVVSAAVEALTTESELRSGLNGLKAGQMSMLVIGTWMIKHLTDPASCPGTGQLLHS